MGRFIGPAFPAAGSPVAEQPAAHPVIALAGNPNVGKSTVFNSLTKMHQHTGNWPGKTVSSARGLCRTRRCTYELVDIPGSYSLMAHSAEEEVARNFICFGEPDAVVVVCDGTCLERNLNLVLQTLEITDRVIVCVNLMDEARRKGIRIDLPALSRRLGVPVVSTVARKKQGLTKLLDALDSLPDIQLARERRPQVRYPAPIENAVAALKPVLEPLVREKLDIRWLALRLLEADSTLLSEASAYLGMDLLRHPALSAALSDANRRLVESGFSRETLRDSIVSSLVTAAEALCRDCVAYEKTAYDETDRRLDRILTGKRVGYPVMLALLTLIFWLTITGANYPSALLSAALFRVQDWLTALFTLLHAPDWLHGLLVLGVYRVLAWVVSVMLPPMAIFFPLFTLLEDAGYLPRIAYNLDKPFQRCRACGKQALCMCMVDNGMRKGYRNAARRAAGGLRGACGGLHRNFPITLCVCQFLLLSFNIIITSVFIKPNICGNHFMVFPERLYLR